MSKNVKGQNEKIYDVYYKSKRWEEAAKICMTHSYHFMIKEFDDESENTKEAVIKQGKINQ